MGVNPVRHREQLIRGLDDDGLEELTLRYVRREHPNAHRTRRGNDGGIDVLSDHELPPAWGWQCKSSSNGTADWSECRSSIRSAMTNAQPPNNYTFVFNFVLTLAQRNFWRSTLLPELQQAYSELSTIDYIDDLDRRIEDRDDLVDWLEDGAYGVYVRRTLKRAAATGVNPMASAVDITEGLSAVAEYAKDIGKTDPRFTYGVTGREAAEEDQRLADRTAHFSMSAGQQGELPAYTVTVRDGDAVQEVTANVRAGALVEPPRPWFADSEEGARARATARAELAKGRAISIEGRYVGVTGGDTPDRFAEWLKPGQPMGRGQLHLGLSEPLVLTITLAPSGMGSVCQQIAMYRVPADARAELAYAGAVGGAVLCIDLTPEDPRPKQSDVDGGRRVNCSFTVTLALAGESSRTALRGLGFARAFGAVDRLHFACPGLLPDGGYEIRGQLPLGDEESETWEVAAKLALALQALTERDGLVRTLPEEVGPRDMTRAETVLRLTSDGEMSVHAEEPDFRIGLPPHAATTDEPSDWMRFVAELPPVAGQPTGLVVEQEVQNANALRIEETDRGTVVLICASQPGGATITMRLAATGYSS